MARLGSKSGRGLVSWLMTHSVRFETAVDAIEAFAAWVCSQHGSIQHAEPHATDPAAIT